MTTFEEFNLSEELKNSIKRLGFKNPTTIQKKSLPLVLGKKDVFGESATGSGKTLAFGCGVIENTEPGKGIQALILTPTRELAEQVKKDIREIAHHKKLKIVPIYGGISINPQIEALYKADVVVATPGRLKDHMNRRTIDLSKVGIVVLDEADRMLDMGFIDDIEFILKDCPKKRQTLLFSATLLPRIEQLARKYMQNPVKVSAQKQVDPSRLKQMYYDVKKNLKLSLLIHLIKNENGELIMIFCNTRKNTDLVVKNLKLNGIKATVLHGGFMQNKRTKSIEEFSDGKSKILVCTDVASRGIHVDGITHIYNYDIPNDATDYVHRIGRTARAGDKGIVINLLCEYDHDNFSRILRDYSEFKVQKAKTPQVERVHVVMDSPQRRGNKRFSNRGDSDRSGNNRNSRPRSRFGSRTRSEPRSGNRNSSSSNRRFGSRNHTRRRE